MRVLALLLFIGCSNSLPPPGMCEVATGSDSATVEPVTLGGGGSYDDLTYSHALGKVVAAPQGTGRVFVVDPASMNVTSIGVPGGVGSADASATRLFVADRGGARIVAFDLATTMMVASHPLTSEPDYLRVSPTTGEVWVTVPGRNRIEILEPTGLAAIASVTTPSPPEGITFDLQGRAYVNGDGAVVAIDVAHRVVVGEWDVGCGYSHGFPQIDLAYGLAMGGCRPNGGVGVTTIEGEQRAGYEAGGGPAVLAYDATLHHLYVRGDPSPTLSILAVCADGQLGELARVPIPERGHGAVDDELGHVWVGDSTTGDLVRITDPYPRTQ
ncbi:MAG TPA: hypothetical protein VIV40_38085 [Kofleriaceae bacterium]